MISDWSDARIARVGFLLSWLALSSPWLSGAVTIPYDAKALFQAQLQFLATALHEGDSPFWNPYAFLGMPQISDPQSLIFSPAALIAYLLKSPSYQSLDVYVLLMLALGGYATLSLCLEKGWHAGGAWLAGVTFAFGGAAAWRLQHIGHIQSYVFFATTLFLFQRALNRRSLPYFAAAGAAAGLMLIEPNQLALLGSYACLGLATAEFATAVRHRRSPQGLLLGFSLTAATCLVIMLIPVALTYLFLLQSNRPSITLAEAAHGSLHPASLLTFMVSDLYGARGAHYWGPYSPHWSPTDLTLSQNMGQFYFGMLPALLIVAFGILRGHLADCGVRSYTGILVFSVLYSVGTFAPAYQVLYHFLPGVPAFRRPVDSLFLAGASISILSGYLVHLWLTNGVRRVSDFRRILELTAIAFLFAACVGVGLWQSRALAGLSAVGSAILWAMAAAFILLVPQAIIRRNTRGTVTLALALVTADLAIHNGPNESSGIVPSRVADVLRPNTSNETIKFLKSSIRQSEGTAWRDRVELVGMGFDWQNCPSVHRFEATLGYNPFRLGIVSSAIGARDYNVGPDQRHFAPLFPSYQSTLSNMLGLRYIVSSVPLQQIDKSLTGGDVRLVKHTADGYIYENMRVLPRASVVGRAIPYSFDRLLQHGSWPSDFDPTRSVLIDVAARRLRPDQPAPSQTDDVGAVSIVTYRNDDVVLEAKMHRDGFLVLNDLWHPWWTALVDGAPSEMLKANGLFRAVRLGRGTHTVTFRFEPLKGALQQAIDLLAERLSPRAIAGAAATHKL